MEGDYKEKSRKSFDKQAKIYDSSNYSKYSRQCYPYVLEELAKIKFNNILNLGCRTSGVLSLLLEQKPNVKAYGLDLSNF
ncbi:tRNA1(Val) A37 N6-methylase TrmN6 [Clostridium tetanomorphum]|uniref:Uncharacterized protein n=1 Tax=Clostridium tetanomorphum TaxID=1553 RepID=A0A923J2K2_CLOTT|nr:hypothetical protein [Clostridium tetanomorphum]KAJ51919.1 type 11 methyltransferase [Clostridium tetanomorphum DSM 665]MBC2398648.1 hypothetical protein [Clostridium tetanomorphum]MBP1864073.1 tRNA1(Val) A37 N6-methylase TrmN6 [Clostridium tetanomorphum]NRS84486.1 tRNA1(Val) A37 N6-methylase TrmN6 [Clostridium tetanomorphum]NRZ97700.1 tRNA1(Val) A37 N6-methylase TrmN6 [Clostridium tetanomorphum]